MVTRNGVLWSIGSPVVFLGLIGFLIIIANLIFTFRQKPIVLVDVRSSSSFPIRHNRSSLSTSVECRGPSYNQSCLFKNLYYVSGGFWAFSSKETNLTIPGVRIDALGTSDYRPKHRIFDTDEELESYIRFDLDPMILSGLTVHFNPHWLKNIGHALFDGLYPSYVGLIRFAPRHVQPFRIFAGLDNARCDDCFSEDVFSRFAGLGLIKSNIVDDYLSKRWFLFDELLMGTGMMCQRCIQSNYQLAAGVELDGSRLFRDRMYHQHGVLPPIVRRNHSAEQRDFTTPIRAYFVHNKRFTEEEQNEMKLALEEINNYTDAHLNKSEEEIKELPFPLIRVIYLNYRNITAKTGLASPIPRTQIDAKSPTYELVDNDFIAQLRVLRQMDIHITGPGTGQMYQTFLSDGSVNINLGGMNPYKKETTPIAYPSFLEQYVTGGTPYIKGLYYPINTRRDGIKRAEVVKLIQQAARLIMSGFAIPVDPKENLAPDGKVFVDQCHFDKDFCTLVTIRKPGLFWCNNMWTEDLVHERRQWAEGGFPMGGGTVSCAFNRTLLRSLREKYGIEYRPGRE